MAYDPNIPYNDLPCLPPALDTDTQTVLLTHALKAARSLAELKGLCYSMTGEALMNLLVNTIVLQESRDSSAIENIVTTQDELYKAVAGDQAVNQATREVLHYREALYVALQYMRDHNNLITSNLMVRAVQAIKQNNAGIRNQPGTLLLNAITGETIHTPPCCEEVIRQKLAALETFINDPLFSDFDPIIKLALIHYQFEAIHPFADGNGRTGRILNALYLVQQKLLPQPVLCLSAYIVDNKELYYRLLRDVTTTGNWKDWILFMTTAVDSTAKLTMKKIRSIQDLKKEMEPAVLKVLEKFGNRMQLLDLMFTMPYLKIEHLVSKGIAHRETASNYLKLLVAEGLLASSQVGRNLYFTNHRLMDILTQH